MNNSTVAPAGAEPNTVRLPAPRMALLRVGVPAVVSAPNGLTSMPRPALSNMEFWVIVSLVEVEATATPAPAAPEMALPCTTQLLAADCRVTALLVEEKPIRL